LLLLTTEENMQKLTDNQLIVLSKAAARDDGVAVAPHGMSKAAAAKVGSSLVARKLMRESRSKPGMPVWRKAEGKNISLLITRAGRAAIGVEEDSTPSDISGLEATDAGAAVKTQKASIAAQPEQHSIGGAPRAGTKQALIVDMLSKEGGVRIDALIKETGWLPHTTRAALTGLRKRGFAVERIPHAPGASLYRIPSRSYLAGAGGFEPRDAARNAVLNNLISFILLPQTDWTCPAQYALWCHSVTADKPPTAGRTPRFAGLWAVQASFRLPPKEPTSCQPAQDKNLQPRGSLRPRTEMQPLQRPKLPGRRSARR
jgi:hypothetical protein